MNDEKKSRIKFALNNFEAYVALVLFFINLVLLFVQVVSRYVFNYSITWCEELATILYVGMIYCAISASVTQRKHLKIEAIYDLVPFKAKKVLMVISNVIFFFFCIYIQAPLYDMVKTLGFAKTSLLHIPKSYVYGMIPAFMLLTAVRIIQDTVRTIKENEKDLGSSIPTIDLDAYEQEYLRSKSAENGGGDHV